MRPGNVMVLLQMILRSDSVTPAQKIKAALLRRKMKLTAMRASGKGGGLRPDDIGQMVKRSRHTESSVRTAPEISAAKAEELIGLLDSTQFGTDRAIVSRYSGRRLKRYLWHDWTSRNRIPLLHDELLRVVYRQQNWPHDPPIHPITYCYLQQQHIRQINELCMDRFWPGIDMSDFLQYPDFSVVAVYRNLVVGAALMTPDGYIAYVATRPLWEGSGIAKVMLYYLIQASRKDITLHVSATNPAMMLYQQLGFKPEEFIVDFYSKYLPPESTMCRNAFFLRYRQ